MAQGKDREPIAAFYEDLGKELKEAMTTGAGVVLGGDVNEVVDNNSLVSFLGQDGIEMRDLIAELHGTDNAPLTCQPGSNMQADKSSWLGATPFEHGASLPPARATAFS